MTAPAEARQGMIDIAQMAANELSDLWPQIEMLPPVQVREVLAELLPEIGDEYGLASATLAADWYDDLRTARQVPGTYVAEPEAPVEKARWRALASWGVDPLFSAEPAYAAALHRVIGGLQRTIADRHRLTIVENSMRDPQAQGWRRVGTGKSCSFCSALIGRGAVYTERSVTFRSHDRCRCAASPVWDSRIVKISREPFRASQRRRTEEQKKRDTERFNEWIRDQ